MKRSTDRFLTTHTGSLPRPEDLIRMMYAKEEGVPVDAAALSQRVAAAVDEVVHKQAAAGVDVINDGEMSKPSFFHYLSERLEGFAPREPKVKGRVVGPMDLDGRDAGMFPDYYRGFLEHSPFENG